MTDLRDRAYAERLDEYDELASFRERFYVRPDAYYMDGNSLGLLSRDAEAAVLNALDEWKTLGIDGWMHGEPPWLTLGEELGRRQAALVGAKADEVVVTGTITTNIHALVASFYEPVGERRKIVATSLDFPSDIYALRAHLRLRGANPEHDLVLIPSADGRTITVEDVIAALRPDVALALLPSVLYRSGQLLDMSLLTAVARERGIPLGWDCAHSAGVIPHTFSDWGVDFAMWCNYKYLNSGPGSVGSLYVNRRHFGRVPALPGWWGYQRERQFDMRFEFEAAAGAAGWQISTIGLLSAAPLIGSLDLFAKAGIDRIRAKSLALTGYLIDLMEARGMLAADTGFVIGTPRQDDRRGGHVAVEHPEATRIVRALKARGVTPDFRPPNVIRLAPIPLYTSFVDVWETIRHLDELVEHGEHRQFDEGRDLVA